MEQYTILTDSGSDLPKELQESLGVRALPLSVHFRGKTSPDSVDGQIHSFYESLRAGEVATTSALNPESWREAMEPELKAGKDLLVIAFSSGLSSTYQSALIAAQALADDYPDRKIRVVDSLCASLGQGLFVWYACKMRDQGLSLDALADWCLDNRLHLCHWFTVDDLMFLRRGGRISAATAVLGTMLSIKPILHVDDEGHLINVGKARGRKASIEALVTKMGERKASYENATVFICHGDCLEDAQYLARRVKEAYGVKEVVIGYTGCVIGSHSGPGTLALFFLGNCR